MDKNYYDDKSTFGKIICCDVDGVILDFHGIGGYMGQNIFGSVKPIASQILTLLKLEGWKIVLYTTRLVTPVLVNHLTSNSVPFDDINGRVSKDGNIRYQYYAPMGRPIDYSPFDIDSFWKHNPTQAGCKPIASVYLDDLDWRQSGKDFSKEDWKQVYEYCNSNF